jgi:hypothetical protein
MPIDFTAAGGTGTHSLAKTNVNLDENFIYYRYGAGVPAALTDGKPFIFRNGTGSLTGLTTNSLVYAKFPQSSQLQFSTSFGGSAIDITAFAAGNTTLDTPFVYNNVLNVPSAYANQQAVKYYTNGTPLTGLVSGNTYYLKSANSGLGLAPLYSFTTATFTNASAVGAAGPTSAAVQSAYSTAGYTWAAANVSQGAFQGYQDWIVPATGIYDFTVAGAGGRSPANGGTGGGGAVVKGRVSLTRGEVITITVGQLGSNTGVDGVYPGSSGGTFVVRKSGNVPLLVAGGGASAVNTQNAPATAITTSGASGQYAGGANGNGGAGAGDSAGGAGGGFFTSGASGYGGGGGNFTNGLVGGAGTTGGSGGGTGGFGGGGGGDGSVRGGAGGAGGYSGGAAGNSANQTGAYHGGSYIIPSATSVGTSTGLYNGASVFNGATIQNLATFTAQNTAGSVVATLVQSTGLGFTFHPTAADANAGTNTIAITPQGTMYHAVVPITLDLENNTINTTSAHGLSSGDALTYRFSGAPATPLTANTTYYVNKINNFTYKLSTTPSPSFTEINFTQPSSAISESFGKVIVNTATDIITIPSHGFLVNQPVNYQVSGTTLKSIS